MAEWKQKEITTIRVGFATWLMLREVYTEENHKNPVIDIRIAVPSPDIPYDELDKTIEPELIPTKRGLRLPKIVAQRMSEELLRYFEMLP